MDYKACMEVCGLRKGDCMKNKAYIVKSALWLLSFMYTCGVCTTAIQLFIIKFDFFTISFAVFGFISCFFCMKNSATNITKYVRNKLKEDEE